LDYVAKGKVKVLTETFPLDDATHAYEKIGVRTKLLADLTTKEFETIFDQKDLGS
jgi:hypothetical protein